VTLAQPWQAQNCSTTAAGDLLFDINSLRALQTPVEIVDEIFTGFHLAVRQSKTILGR